MSEPASLIEELRAASRMCVLRKPNEDGPADPGTPDSEVFDNPMSPEAEGVAE